MLVIAFILSLKKRLGIANFFRIYLLYLFLLYAVSDTLLVVFRSGLRIKGSERLPMIMDYCFICLEFLVFMHFYYQLLPGVTTRRLLLLAGTLFLAFWLAGSFSVDFSDSFSSAQQLSRIYFVQLLVLLFPALGYFLLLLKRKAPLRLNNDPKFWVSSGILMLLASSVPFTAIEVYFSEYSREAWREMYVIYYLLYIILLSMLIRAYLCGKPVRS